MPVPVLFGPWSPDLGPFSGDSIDTVVNALPIARGWGPMPKLASFTQALSATCRGAWWFRSSDGTFKTVAATQTNLWLLNTTTLAWTAIGKLGSDTITNGTFAVDANWTKDTNWTISGGEAHATAVANGDGLSQAQALTAGTVYKIVFTVNDFSAGGVKPIFTGGTQVDGTTVTANGTYTQYLTAVTGNNAIEFQAVGTTTLDIDNVSMKTVGGYTGPATGELWTAAVFGTNFYVTNINDPLQVINVDSGTEFADASGSPPQAKYIATVGDFLFLAHLKSGATTYPRKWQHSAINDPTDWSISGTSGDSDDQEIPDGEEITGILPMAGSSARVFQKKARRMLVFSPGSNPVFQQVDIDSPSEGSAPRGAIAPHAIVPLGGVSYFALNETGFYLNDEFTPIGAERVDNWFFDTVDRTKIGHIQAVADIARKIVWVRFQDQAGIHQMIGYHWQLDRWLYSDVAAIVLVSSATPGFVLDDLPNTLDSYPDPIDSPYWQGGAVTFGAFKSDNILYLFSGEKSQATIESATIEFSPGMTSYVSGARLMSNITDYTMQVGTSMLPDGALSWSSPNMRNSRDGRVPFRADAFYHRFRLNISEGGVGTHVHGASIDVEPSGEA